MDPTTYEPDASSIDALVDGEGRQHPAPTEAELAAASYDPIDAAEVLAALAQARDLADSYLISGTGTIEDRIRLFVALGDATSRDSGFGVVKKLLGERIAADLDAPTEVDGTWWKQGRSKSTTGWDKPSMIAAINRAVMADDEADDAPRLVDTRTGVEIPGPTAAVAIARLWKFAEVATGRTKVLRDGADIDADEYAKVTWTDTIEVMPTTKGTTPAADSVGNVNDGPAL